MDGKPHIGCISAELNSQRHFGDELTRVRTHDATTDHPMRLRIEQQLGETLVATLSKVSLRISRLRTSQRAS